MELEQSRETMKAPWNPVDMFEVLCRRFNEAIVQSPPQCHSQDGGIQGPVQRVKVYNLPGSQHILVNVLEFWVKKCKIKQKFKKMATWAPEPSGECRARSKRPSTRSLKPTKI